IHRVNAGKYHRLYFFKSFYLLRGGVAGKGNGIAHFHLFRIFDTGNDIAHIACLYFLLFCHLQLQDTNFIRFIFLPGGYKLYLVPFLYRPVEDTVINDNAPEAVKYTVEDKRLQRRLFVSFRRRYFFYNSLQNTIYTQPGSPACQQYIFRLAADKINDLVFYLFYHSTIHINL